MIFVSSFWAKLIDRGKSGGMQQSPALHSTDRKKIPPQQQSFRLFISGKRAFIYFDKINTFSPAFENARMSIHAHNNVNAWLWLFWQRKGGISKEKYGTVQPHFWVLWHFPPRVELYCNQSTHTFSVHKVYRPCKKWPSFEIEKKSKLCFRDK